MFNNGPRPIDISTISENTVSPTSTFAGEGKSGGTISPTAGELVRLAQGLTPPTFAARTTPKGLVAAQKKAMGLAKYPFSGWDGKDAPNPVDLKFM
jgi:hypothetical protein